MKGNISILLLLITVAGGMGACRSGHGDAGDAPEAPLSRLVDLGSHRIHIFCLGEGLPTVVIDTGWGDASANWHSLQTRIARDTRVCVYDRAGYGWSEPGPEPRSSRQVVYELKRLLEAAGLEGPYVLVGHSLGGLNMRLFASQYPAMVAGVVLLDPPPMPFILGEAFPDLYQMADQTTLELQQAAAAARQASDTEERARATYYQTLASEHAMMFSDSAEQLKESGSMGALPLVVVASGRSNPAFEGSAEAFQQFWIEQNRALTALSSNGAFILAEESGHNLYAEAPDLVLDAIRQVVEQSR